MKAESIVFTVAGMCFGIILGWVLGSSQAGRVSPVTQVAGAPGPAANNTAPQATLDEARVQELSAAFKANPKDAATAEQLGNVYFDGARYEDAITWYEQALKLDPKNVNVSTDLGVSYYYTNRADRALQQFDYSLQLDAQHTKTLLNQGIVLAFGKEDLNAAAAAWQKVVEIAPDSPEGQAARRALDGVAAAHQNRTPGQGS
jgi:tetratricopeptide (TPR) repeat protein